MALMGCLLGEMGDKSQSLVQALAKRFERNSAVIAGILAAAVANAAIAACAGALIGPMLGGNARLLFLALAILFLGIGMMWPVKSPELLEGWRVGPFLTATLGVFILGFGEGGQFLILGLSARTAEPVLAAVGGAVGVTAALIPAVLLRDSFTALPLRAIRQVGGVIMLVTAFILTVQALELA